MRKRFGWIIAGLVILLIIIGSVVFFGNRFLKKQRPDVYIARAFNKTVGEIKVAPHSVIVLLEDVLNGAWQQDITVSINRLKQNMVAIDAQYLAVAEVLTLKNTTVKDTAAQQLNSRFSVQLAVTPLVELLLYGDTQRLAFQVPQAFDYYVALNPAQVVDEWEASLAAVYLGAIAGQTHNDLFYDYYKRLLFEPSVHIPSVSDFSGQAGMLLENAEYTYLGKETALTADGEKDCDVYGVELTESALNAYWTQIYPQTAENETGGLLRTWAADAVNRIRFSGGLSMRIRVYAGKIAGVQVSFHPVYNDRVLTGEVDLTLTGALAVLDTADMQIRLSDGDETHTIQVLSESRFSIAERVYNQTTVTFGEAADAETLRWTLRWDQMAGATDNFEFTAENRYGVHTLRMGATGSLVADYDNRRIEGAFKELFFFVDDLLMMDVSLNVKYLLRASEEPIIYNESAARPLTDISEFDLLEMYARLMDNPPLSRVLENLIP